MQAKLKRLLLGSSLVMFAGFIAVFAAIFYKINSSGSAGNSSAFVPALEIGAISNVEAMTSVDGVLFLLARDNDRQVLIRIDASTGAILSRSSFEEN